MPDTSKAVFISYASQDADAARRICEALRSGGVEVWFDADGGLEHGDEWDAKIRRQIKECVLFLPLISANTQARHEGYFRIEWELAAQRALGIASGVPFILPVVIDDTREPVALVPDRFRMVQWTRLPGGEVPPEVQQRFLKLWSHRAGALQAASVPRENSAAPAGRSGPPWLVGAAAAAVLLAASLLILQWRSSHPRQDPALRNTPAAAPNETDAIVKQAREFIYDPDSARNEFALAENLLKRATDLAPGSGAALGASALLNHYFYSRGYDSNRQRLVRSQAEAEKALRLDSRNTDALLALGLHRQELDEKDRARDYFERALAADPQNFKAIIGRSLLIDNFAERANFLLDAARTSTRPAELFYYASLSFERDENYEAARVATDRAIAAQPFWRASVQRAEVEAMQTASSAKIDAWLDRVPELKRDEPRVAFMRSKAAMFRRDGAAALRALNAIATDYFDDNFFIGPKAYLLAQALEQAGRPKEALEQWTLAERGLREKLAAEPGTARWRPMLAVALASQNRGAEARALADIAAADQRVTRNRVAAEILASAFARLGDPAQAIVLLGHELIGTLAGFVSAATLAADPGWDSLRAHPDYAPLVTKLKRREATAASASVSATQSAHTDRSIAVLAFANLSDDKANEYFSDGISEELLNVLAKVPGLKVAARTSAFYFKGKEVPIPEIAQKLGVAYVVEGSVRKAGNQVRITAQLIKAADGFPVWSETFPRDLKDIFAVQDEIAKNILRAVKGSLMPEAEMPRARTTKIEAYTLFLQGQGAFARRGDAGLREAIRLFEAALAIDPDYVPALVGLGQARGLVPLYANLNGAKAREMIDGATSAARRVLALDAQNAGAYAILGWVMLQFELRWSEGLAAVLRARDLAPNDSWVWNTLGDYYRYVGDLPQAMVAKQRAWELDPLSAVSHWDIAYVHVVAGNHDEAIRWSEKTVALAPHNLDSYMPGILAAGKAGRLDVMRRTLVAARQNVRENEGMLFLLEALAAILEKKSDDARALLSKVVPLVESGDGSPAYLGYCYLLLGDSERAAFWLQRAFELRDPAIVWNEQVDFNVIAANPATRPILDQPGLKELFEMRQRHARGIVPNR